MLNSVARLIRKGDVWYYHCPIHLDIVLTHASLKTGHCPKCDASYLYRPTEIPEERAVL